MTQEKDKQVASDKSYKDKMKEKVAKAKSKAISVKLSEHKKKEK